MSHATTALYSTHEAAIPALPAFDSLQPTCPQYLEVARGFALTDDGFLQHPRVLRLSVRYEPEGALRFQKEILQGSMDGQLAYQTDMGWAGFDAYCRWSDELAGYLWNINEPLFVYPDYYTPVPNLGAILEAVRGHDSEGAAVPDLCYEHWAVAAGADPSNGDVSWEDTEDMNHFGHEDENAVQAGGDWVFEGSAMTDDRDWVFRGWGCTGA